MDKNQSNQNELRVRAKEFIHKNPAAIKEFPLGDAEKLIEDLQIHQIELEMQNEELRRAQLELETARDKYSDLYDFAPVGYFTFDETTRIQDVNLMGADLLGCQRSKLFNMTLTSFISPDSQDEFYFHCKQLFESEKRQTCTLKLKRQDGASIFAKFESMAVADKTGNLKQIRTALSDITAEMHVRKLVRESEQKLRQVFDQMVSAAALTEVMFNKSGKPQDYRYLEVNPAFEKITGKPRSEVIGKTLLEVFPGTERYWLQNFEKVVLTGDPIQIEDYHRGLEKYFFVSGFRPQEGQVALTFMDITERVHIQKAMQEAHDEMEKRVKERTAELAKSNELLTREIAERRRLSYRFLNAQEDERRRISRELHDELGQDLSVLKLQVDSLKRQPSKSQIGLKEDIANISANLSKTIENVRKICHELIPSVLVDLGLAPALRWLIKSLAEHSHIAISLNMSIAEGLFPTDRQIAIYRIFQEILTNIRKHSQATQVSIRIGRDENKVVFRIEDNGIGFDIERIKSIPATERGLGLAALEERVKMLDGNLDVYSRLGAGSRYAFEIPIASSPESAVL